MPQPMPTNPGTNPPGPPALPPKPWFGRLAVVAVPFRRLGRWYAYQPRVIQVGLVVVMAVGLVAGSLYTFRYLRKRNTAAEVSAGWQDYRLAAERGDTEAIRAALDRVLAARPDDDRATRYKVILDRGQADPDTPELALVFLNQYIQSPDRLSDATREAEVVLAVNPKHWLSRCVVAHHALQIRKDPALAEQHLAQLPDPEDPNGMLNPGGLLYALRLFELVGRDADRLHRTIVHRLLPLMRGTAATNAPPAAKIQLLHCYLEPFNDSAVLSQLAAYWAVADRLADEAVNGAAATADASALLQLGLLGSRMRGALATLRAHDPISLPDDRFTALARAIDDRTRRAWQALRQSSPDRPEAYLGLAVLAYRDRNPGEAVQQILDGLAACGDRTELFDLLIQITARAGDARAVTDLVNRVIHAAEAAQDDPAKWCLVAAAKLVAGRPDHALEACRRARQLVPNHPWACFTEAQIWLRTGDYVKAREALTALGEVALRTRPELARLHGRAMAGSGLWPLLDGELKAIIETQTAAKPKNFAPAVRFLQGALEVEPTVPRVEWVVAQITRILVEAPDAPAARRLQAEALYRLAELTVTPHPKADGSPPVWNPDRVAVALRAFDQLRTEERVEVSTIATIGVLQLKGQGLKATALRTITPLLPLENLLTPAQLEIVGAILTANDRSVEAVRMLERATQLPGARAGCWVALALAYRANNQPDDAAAALRAAFEFPGASDREHAERVAAKILFQREITR